MRHTAIAVLTAALLCATSARAAVNVVATTPDLGAIAAAVGGDRVDVRSVAKGYQDPHYLEAKPSYMRVLNRADLLVYTGLELEVGWLPLLIQGARNPRLASSASGLLDASAGIRVLEVPAGQVDRSGGDVHPLGNPHYMLDPRNGLAVASRIAERLRQIDPDGSDVYDRNLKAFQEGLTARIDDWEARASHLNGQRIIAYHKQWEYLADWLGLQIVDEVEDKPGIPPSPRHVADLVDRMKSEGIRLIISANYVDTKPAERLSDQTGAQLLSLPISVGGEPDIHTYADLFEVLVSRLEKAFPAP